MGLTVGTPASTVLLTTVEQVRLELGVASASNDELFQEFIRQAGAMADKYCSRIFPRQRYTETAAGYGGPYLTLRQAPVLTLHSLSHDGTTITDASITDSGKGLLYREAGFYWTAQRYDRVGLGSGLFLSAGMPLPLSEEPTYTADYTAGFLTRAQNLTAVATVSASSVDNSFNDTASGFPSQLQAGDIIETSGFSNAANNGRFVVSGTPTTAKVVVAATLTTEAAAAGRSVRFATLPGDVERGIIEIVKSLYAQRATDSMLIEKQAGPMRLRYSENRGGGEVGLPPTAAALLRPWIRRAS